MNYIGDAEFRAPHSESALGETRRSPEDRVAALLLVCGALLAVASTFPTLLTRSMYLARPKAMFDGTTLPVPDPNSPHTAVQYSAWQSTNATTHLEMMGVLLLIVSGIAVLAAARIMRSGGFVPPNGRKLGLTGAILLFAGTLIAVVAVAAIYQDESSTLHPMIGTVTLEPGFWLTVSAMLTAFLATVATTTAMLRARQ